MSLFHLIAPSGYCIKQHAALRGIQRLTDAGHQVNNVEVIARRCERFAGTETERLEDLNSLARLTTPNTIVLAVRGGYGASRLLADIDWQALVARQQHDPLLICGHSDFTAIQCGLLAHGNVITFSGPMLVANFGADELNAFTEHHFWLALRNVPKTSRVISFFLRTALTRSPCVICSPPSFVKSRIAPRRYKVNTKSLLKIQKVIDKVYLRYYDVYIRYKKAR